MPSRLAGLATSIHSDGACTSPPAPPDAIVIANYLLQQACKREGRTVPKLSAEAIAAIECYSWPGNVRELENRINAAAIMVDGKFISAEDLSLDVPAEGDSPLLPLREVRQRAESAAVERALAVAGGNISRAAELLGVTRPTLYDLMERSSMERTAAPQATE